MKILRPEDKVCEIIEYEKKRPRIISVVGAGGKTTLIYRLAEERGIAVMATDKTMFTACGLLYSEGLRGGVG